MDKSKNADDFYILIKNAARYSEKLIHDGKPIFTIVPSVAATTAIAACLLKPTKVKIKKNLFGSSVGGFYS